VDIGINNFTFTIINGTGGGWVGEKANERQLRNSCQWRMSAWQKRGFYITV
jgi:hypothetical protein